MTQRSCYVRALRNQSFARALVSLARGIEATRSPRATTTTPTDPPPRRPPTPVPVAILIGAAAAGAPLYLSIPRSGCVPTFAPATHVAGARNCQEKAPPAGGRSREAGRLGIAEGDPFCGRVGSR